MWVWSPYKIRFMNTAATLSVGYANLAGVSEGLGESSPGNIYSGRRKVVGAKGRVTEKVLLWYLEFLQNVGCSRSVR